MRRALLPLLLISACVARQAPAEAEPEALPPPAPEPPRIVVTEAPPPVAPPPGDLALPPAPDSVQSALYSKQLDFRAGEPMLPIRLMERQDEVTFEPLGRVRLVVSGSVEKRVEAPAGTRFRVRVLNGRPAALRARVILAEFPGRDREGLEEARALWTSRGLEVSTVTLGGAFGIAGKVIDNRRRLLVTGEALSPEAARERQAELLRTFNARTHLHEELETQPTGVLELLDAAGASVALGEGRILAETPGGEGFRVHRVEYGVGYDFHGFEDRSVRGSLQLSVDRHGQLAVVNIVPLEVLLYGLVPAEIFARAHPEALKAQAVTARGEVLAKIGTKHLADPYLLCSEQHCAVYKGRSGEAATTTAAVDATRGEGLFDASGRLVDSVYSAVCGGHTEHNENVWGGPPNPSLRGRPDVPNPPPPGIDAAELPAFLEGGQTAYCQTTTFAQPKRFRWSRRFTSAQVDALTRHLDIGPVRALTVVERGVSGRASLLTLSGERGASQIRGELNIRRLFGMLNSSMFTLHPEVDDAGNPVAWTFRGGGWGHGVGMCQTGAIGRAEHGQDYRQILSHYYNGAQVAPIY
ncbi:MAG TPA: SpoIID/LytB domain-containing protein [Myxococcaceae bacterium]|nr:SpoIID/LytB domain-containing protein [Myxococcaceae bacterium]